MVCQVQKYLLNSVLCFASVADHSEGDSEDQACIAIEELRKSNLISRAQSQEKFFISRRALTRRA